MSTATVDLRGVHGASGRRAWPHPIRDGKLPWILDRPFPDYRRLDALSRAVCLAAEALETTFHPETAVVLATSLGCLHTDRLFEASRHGVIRPGLFPYTLPSTCLAELAIRHGIRGPLLVLVVAPGDTGTASEEAARMLACREAPAALVLSGDVDPPGTLSMTARVLHP